MTIQHHVTDKQTKKGLGRLKGGTISRSSVLKIVAILAIFIGMGTIIRQNHTCQIQLKQYQKLQVFLKIDDLGHEGIFDTRKRRSIYDSGAGITQFEKMDADFHSTNNVNEKYTIAKEMDTLMEQIDANIHKVGGIITPEEIARDQKFHELDTLFNQLK